MNNREEFTKKILFTFRVEATEAIQKITKNVIELEKGPPPSLKAELIEATFREAHSLKGAARAVNIPEIESLCQALENLFSALKNNIIELVPAIFDLLHLSLDSLEVLVTVPKDEIHRDLKEKVSELSLMLLKVSEGKFTDTESLKLKSSSEAKNEILPDIKAEFTQDKKSGQNPSGDDRTSAEQTIRISTEKLDELLSMTEEMLSVKLSSSHYTEELHSTMQRLETLQNGFSEMYTAVNNLRHKLESGMDNKNFPGNAQGIKSFIDFFDSSDKLLKNVKSELKELWKFSAQRNYQAAVKIDALLDEVKKIISVPFSTILDVFPRNARELAKDCGKYVELVIHGADIEVDRRILEEIRIPLMHLLRNSIDHGIEKPEVRKKNNKSEKARVVFKISRLEDNKIEIVVSDDGAGIDFEKLRAKYISLEHVVSDKTDNIPDQLLLDYLFKSGVSTSDFVSDLSGRGLGLAIVSEKIEQLGGKVSVKTISGEGTEFTLHIPLSLETYRCIHFLAGKQEFVLPTHKVERVLKIKKSGIRTFENKEGITIEGKVLPLIHLSKILEIPFDGNEKSDYHRVLVIGPGNNQIGILVNEIIGEEEVLVKRFNKHLSGVRNISGATVLGSGRVVPILKASDLFDSAVHRKMSPVISYTSEKDNLKRSVLVIEDSITSRMLLKNILESAGYGVTTAIDGLDGFSKLKEGKFNLVVSDIAMPRMNGFDLTAKIRADKDFSGIPVVLVTSLSNQEDRERGMEVGANAYIIKSGFDQNNLLEVIEKLI